jgi:uncharacterized membrane protein YhhN
MNTTRVLVFFLFWVALFADCFLIITQKIEYRIYTKTLLAPLVLIGIYLEGQNTKHTRSKLIANGAFFFCFLGDIILLSDDIATNFISGLICFLVAHIFFIVFFYRLKNFTVRHVIFNVVTAVAITAYISVLLLLVWRNVSFQNFQLPMTVYSIVLGLTVLTALNTIKNRSTKKLATKYFIPGAIFFVLSDSILALNKFYSTFNYSGVVIMLTYAIAIFLLGNGIIRFLKK